MKRAFSVFLLAGVIFVLGLSAQAADGRTMLQSYVPGENALRVFLSPAGEEIPAAEDFTATLGGAAAKVTQAEAAGEQPVTYYCLANTFGSLSQSQLARQKQALLAICAQLSRNDRMVIAHPGEEASYLWDRDALTGQIRELSAHSEGINLCGWIAEALRNLASSPSASPRKCLVVLSSGWDNPEEERQEAESAVRQYRIPVYILSVADEEAAEAMEVLRAFARNSPGGTYQTVGLNQGESAGNAVVEDMRADLVLTLNLPRARLDSSALLTVRYEAGEAVYEDSLSISTAGLTQNEEEDEPDPAEASGGFHLELWMVAVAVLLVAAVILLLPSRPKKRGRRSAPPAEPPAPPAPEPPAPPAESAPSPAAAQIREEISMPPHAWPPEDRAEREPPSREVTFSAIGHPDIRVTVRLPENEDVTLGRNRRADRVLNPEDRRLSSIHCRVRLSGSALLVRDAGSTNGTSVNGVPLPPGGSARVENGQTLRAGSYDYRVHIA